MKEIFKLKLFWSVFILFSIIIFIILINFNRIYKSEIDVLIIPKSEEAVANAEQIIENFRSIPYSLSFFNKMAKNNEDVMSEAVQEMPNYKKRNYWNSKINVERISTSGILKVITLDKDQYRAETFSRQSIRELIGLAGFYYNIKNDIDIRVIDGPITQYANYQPKITLALESIVVGFFLIFLIFLISFSFPGKKEKMINLFPAKKHIFKEEKAWFNVAKPKLSNEKKAVAPSNLPIAENFILSKEKEEAEKKENTIKKTSVTREATPEEVKERLNKLLGGKM